ncbi:MAG: hypothetical protein WCI45_14245 [Desulfuromonadales bacterium]
MKADLPEIIFGESPRHPLYRDLKSFCDNADTEKLIDTAMLKSYLRSANTPRANHYLCLIEGGGRNMPVSPYEHRFSDEFDQCGYPILEEVPRPKLAPDLEQRFYYKEYNRSDKNSLPWFAAMWLTSNLPVEELIGFTKYLQVILPDLIEKDKTRDPSDPMPQTPELIHAFLKILIEKTSQKTLKRRWGKKYDKIMDRYNFIGYRVEMRNIDCASHKKRVKEAANKTLAEDTNQALSSLLLPAHLR